MSEQLSVLEADVPAPHPIHLVVTDDLERNPLPGGSQVDAAVGDVLREPERGQLLDHRAHRGG